MTKKTEKNENVYCQICYLQSDNSPDVKFHLYEEGTFSYPTEMHICQKCLDWVNFMRKMASEQAKFPEKDSFENSNWWWQPKKEGHSAAEMCVK